MSYDNQLNSDYEIMSESELSNIICHFSPDMISDIVDTTIRNNYTTYTFRATNIINSLENFFKQNSSSLPDYTNEILSSRNSYYLGIIQQICSYHKLSCVADFEQYDVYSVALYLYDLLVSNFGQNVVHFFTNYIVAECDTLYDTLSMVLKKKELSNYTKKFYKIDSKIAMIHSNLDLVLLNICSYDIDLEKYIDFVYIDRKIANFVKSILVDNGDFFKLFVAPYVANFSPIIITNIKFALQGMTTEYAGEA